ncbi:MAG: class II aldolase/adducin family protein, partial [Gammaproteobacteria bacterium]|nr:class II aldolase/adducin family protein [Gammaproteobacteria bacterium]
GLPRFVETSELILTPEQGRAVARELGQAPAALLKNHGVVVVGCNIHDSMIGYIYVAQSQSFISSDLGIAHIAATNPSSQISIWHPYAANGAESRQTFEVNQLEKNTTGEYIVEIELTPPPPRDSFEDTFGAIGHH